MQPLPDILAGCKVFPCSPGTKDPATPHGWKDASNDPAQIQAWQRINPDFNWAAACGPSGLFVFDVDPAGLDWWAKLLARDPVIKAAVDRAFQVRTPKGGLHIYFRGEGPSTASRIAEGIDTRGGIMRNGAMVSGGYVVLPGSRTKAGPGRVDGAYEALPGGRLEPLPDFMQALVPERKRTDTLGLAKNPDGDKPRNISWAVDLLKGYVANGRISVQGHGGNNLAYQVAASILDKAISPGVCFDLMWENWNSACSPPWDDFELEGIIRNAANYGEDTGGGVKGFQANEDAFANFAGKEYEAPEPIAKRSRFQPMWLRDARLDVKPAKWLIPGYLPDTGVGILYGLSGSYKTFLALDWALCLAHGIAGQWGAAPEKHVVLFLAGESSYALRQERADAWCEHHGLKPEDAEFIIVPGVPAYHDKEGWQEIREGLLGLKAQPSLIVLDTLSRAMTGLDENSNDDGKLMMKFCEELAQHYGAFVLAVGHTGKDQAKGLRGAQAFIDYSDAAFAIAKRSDGVVTIKVKKLKEVDIPDDPVYLAIKKMETSIVLERTTAVAEPPRNGKPSRYAWAEEKEVVKTLQGMGGAASLSTLAQTISGRIGVELAIVKTKLLANEALKWLRPDTNSWVIPQQEYDL